MASDQARAGDVTLRPGAKVRLTDACPWPERRGCDGDMEVSADADGSFRFKLTDQGNAKARRLISEPGEAQEFYDRLVTSEMEKMGDG